MPEIDRQPELSPDAESFTALNLLAERLVLLDEIALGADVRTNLYVLGLRERDALAEWRATYEWQITQFFEHYYRAETYTAQDVADTLELANRLIGQAEFFMTRD